MIRLAYRQFRVEAATALVALGIVAVVLAVTGPQLVHVYDTTPNRLGATDRMLQGAVPILLVVTPALLGSFFGAPIVARELETGTFRLAWTQSVSRTRWLLVKLGLAGIGTAAVSEGLSLMASWWANPINLHNQNRFSPATFGMFGIVPFGYALFAFALGATAGLLFRRTLPAMATTLAAYIGARLAVTYWIRPHFEAPLRRITRLNVQGGFGFSVVGRKSIIVTVFPPTMRNAWALSASLENKSGHSPTSSLIVRLCPTVLPRAPLPSGPNSAVQAVGGPMTCMAKLGRRFHEVVTYQPASRYWPFQIDETALFVVLAAALAAVCVWWVRRRLV